jgi:hypothetical protein
MSRRCRKIARVGEGINPRCINSKYGTLRIQLQEVECVLCGARFCPLLDALKLEPYERSDDVLEKEVISAVIDTNYPG